MCIARHSARTVHGSLPAAEGPVSSWHGAGMGRADGTPLLELKGHGLRLASATFSPDGMRIVTASWDRTARVWDTRAGMPLLELKGHSGEVRIVTLSPDGLRIVTGSDDTTARVWDAADRDAPPRTEGAHAPVVERGIQPGWLAHRHRKLGPDGAGVGRTDGHAPPRTEGAYTPVVERGIQSGRGADRHRR